MTKEKNEKLSEETKTETNEKGWEEAKSGDVVELQEGETIEGIYKGISESVLYPESWALALEVKGEQQVVFVNSIVFDLIKKHSITENTKIKLKFLELKRNKKDTFDYKTYSLFYKK